MVAAGMGLIVIGYLVRDADVVRHNSLQFALTVVGVVFIIGGVLRRR